MRVGGDGVCVAKYRRSKIKRKHHVVKELEPGLTFLSGLSQVDGIIPGPIHPKTGGKVGFSFQYWTPSGFKLLGRSSGAVQEIFVISTHPVDVTTAFHQAGYLGEARIPTPGPTPPEGHRVP
jgi:hypothetical protein